MNGWEIIWNILISDIYFKDTKLLILYTYNKVSLWPSW